MLRLIGSLLHRKWKRNPDWHVHRDRFFLYYNGKPHGLRRRPDQKDYTVRMQQFFDYFLKDGQKPGWMEKGIPYIEREKEKETHNSVYGENK